MPDWARIANLPSCAASPSRGWVGVFALGCNTIAQLLMMPADPLWSLTVFALDILAIYGLIAYGKRISS